MARNIAAWCWRSRKILKILRKKNVLEHHVNSFCNNVLNWNKKLWKFKNLICLAEIKPCNTWELYSFYGNELDYLGTGSLWVNFYTKGIHAYTYYAYYTYDLLNLIQRIQMQQGVQTFLKNSSLFHCGLSLGATL